MGLGVLVVAIIATIVVVIFATRPAPVFKRHVANIKSRPKAPPIKATAAQQKYYDSIVTKLEDLELYSHVNHLEAKREMLFNYFNTQKWTDKDLHHALWWENWSNDRYSWCLGKKSLTTEFDQDTQLQIDIFDMIDTKGTEIDTEFSTMTIGTFNKDSVSTPYISVNANRLTLNYDEW